MMAALPSTLPSTGTPESKPGGWGCSIIEQWFGLCKEVVLPTPTVLTTAPPAPRTPAELAPGGWTVEDLWTQQALTQQEAQEQYDTFLRTTGGGAAPGGEAQCHWYEAYDAGRCTFPSAGFLMAVGGGVLLLVLLRR